MEDRWRPKVARGFESRGFRFEFMTSICLFMPTEEKECNVLVEQRNARHLVTVEIAGSIPVGDALEEIRIPKPETRSGTMR